MIELNRNEGGIVTCALHPESQGKLQEETGAKMTKKKDMKKKKKIVTHFVKSTARAQGSITPPQTGGSVEHQTPAADF